MSYRKITVGNVVIGGNSPMALISGPCQLESRDHTMFMAESIAKGYSLKGKEAADKFYVSDFTKGFEKSTQTFFGKKIELKEERIFD